MSLAYDPKFDCRPPSINAQYQSKLTFDSTQRRAVDLIPAGARVLDLGCAGGYVGAALKQRGCFVVGVDVGPLGDGVTLDGFHQHDLNDPELPVDVADFDFVLLLDVIEHLRSPESFVERLKERAASAPDLRIIASTGNIGFLVTRLMLLLGVFNYGKRGILDLTHTRLFTFGSFTRLFDQAGYEVLDVQGVPAPFPFALRQQGLARLLLTGNRALIRLGRGLFSYQCLLVVKPYPPLAYLLEQAHRSSEDRARALKQAGDRGRADETLAPMR
jgi:SAM-dependent methyltransferase